jgi:hypothetical protein
VGRLLCLMCGVETDEFLGEPLAACPSCGDRSGMPADLDRMVAVRISEHELRILTMWATNWAARSPETTTVMRVIVDRLATQTSIPLTLSQEIADVRAAFPDATVTVRNEHGPVDL